MNSVPTPDSQAQISQSPVSSVRPSRAMPILDVGFALRNARPELTSTDKHLLRAVAFELGRGTPRPYGDEFRLSIGQLATLMSAHENTVRTTILRLCTFGILTKTAIAFSVVPPTYRVNVCAIVAISTGAPISTPPKRSTPPLSSTPTVLSTPPLPNGVPHPSQTEHPLESEESEESDHHDAAVVPPCEIPDQTRQERGKILETYGFAGDYPPETPRSATSPAQKSERVPVVDIIETKGPSSAFTASVEAEYANVLVASENVAMGKKKPSKPRGKVKPPEPPTLTVDDLNTREREVHDAIVGDRHTAPICTDVPELARKLLSTADRIGFDAIVKLNVLSNWLHDNPGKRSKGNAFLSKCFSNEKQGNKLEQGSFVPSLITTAAKPAYNGPKDIPPIYRTNPADEARERNRRAFNARVLSKIGE